MYKDFEMLNQSALAALSNNDIYRAQTLLRKNAKEQPCFATFNNLGVFYVFEGLFSSDDKRRNAKKLGVNYLKKAETHKEHNLTFLALGWVQFEVEDYTEASRYFRQACLIKPDYATSYNLAVSLYKMSMYQEALEWFKKALNSCDSSVYTETYVMYLFSLLHIDKSKCREALTQLLDDDTIYMESDKFILAYLCDDMRAAERQIKPMLKHWSIEIDEMAMVFDCLFKLNKEEKANIYMKQKLELLEEQDHNTKTEINRLRKAFSQIEYREKLISSFRYKRPLVKQCCYYGCIKHHPISFEYNA